MGLDFYNKLLAVERDLLELSPEDRHAARLIRSAPLLDNYRTWLEANADTATPKSLSGKAISHSQNQWLKLTAFLQDGRLEIGNNRSERSIKPFVIGRRTGCFPTRPKAPPPVP